VLPNEHPDASLRNELISQAPSAVYKNPRFRNQQCARTCGETKQSDLDHYNERKRIRYMVRNMNIKDEDTGPIKKVSMVNKMSNNSSAKL